MKKKWRSRIAAILSGVLFLLTVTAELAHRHGNLPAELQLVSLESAAGQSANIAGKSHTCGACLLSLTSLAVAPTTTRITIQRPFLFLNCTAPSFCSLPLPLSCTLRAPPAVFA